MKSSKFNNHYQKVLNPLEENEEILDLLETTNALSVEDPAIGNTNAKKVVVPIEVIEEALEAEEAETVEEEVLLAAIVTTSKEEIEAVEVADQTTVTETIETIAEIEMIEVIDSKTEMKEGDMVEEEDLHHQDIALNKEEADQEAQEMVATIEETKIEAMAVETIETIEVTIEATTEHQPAV